MAKLKKVIRNRSESGSPAAVTPSPGRAVSQAQLVRTSNRWRDAYNPLRTLVIAKAIVLLEWAERGSFAELMVTMRKVERRYPILKALKANRLAAITRLDYDILIPDDLPENLKTMAEAQQVWLKCRYALITNLKEALRFLALAEFRGFAILQKHRYMGGENDGAVSELHWLPQWNFSRDGWFGDFYWNEKGQFGAMPETLGEQNRIYLEGEPNQGDPNFADMRAATGGNAQPGLDRNDFIIRECDTPLYEIALIAFINWSMGRKDWAAFTEIFGIAKAIVTLPPNIPPDKVTDYQNAAEKVSEGVAGALPHGSTATFPTSGIRNNGPFKEFCDAQDEDVVMAGTGGKLTMMAESGSGTLSGGAHQKTFDRLAEAEGDEISEILQRDFDRLEINAKFPGQPVLAYFKLQTKPAGDITAITENIVRLESAGLQAQVAEISEKTGLQLTRVALPATEPNVGGNASGRPTAPLPEAEVPGPRPKSTIQNSLRSLRTATGGNDFTAAIADDLQLLRDRVAAIEAISDPDLRAAKFAAMLGEWDQFVTDITADPGCAQMLVTNRDTHAWHLILNGGNPNHDSKGLFASGQELAAFHDEARSQTSNEHRVKSYRAVDAGEADRIKQATGLDVSGHEHAVDNYALRHIDREHGNAETEKLRGQLPVTRDDIARLPEITANPDKIEHAGETKLGRAGIRYTKQMDGKTVVVEEVRTKAKLLVPVSIQKFKNRVTIDAQAPISTSETLHPTQT